MLNGKLQDIIILIDSGSNISVISEELVERAKGTSTQKGDTIEKGIGGPQVAGSPVNCKVHFKSGWDYTYPLRPMKLLEHSNMVLLGADFMSLFDETMFDWVRGRIRVGSEWVWIASSSDKKVPCKFDYDNTFSVDIDKFKSIVMNYLDIFAQNPKAPKECNGRDHEIVLSEDRVCVDRVHRIPKKSPKAVAIHVQEMLKNGIIQRSASSYYNSNPLLVNKKDGSKRFVVDFRSLNKITKCDNYPIPNIDDLIESWRDSKVFSQLDLASGYWCVLIAEKDRHKTAFSVPKGKFDFVRMPFGLSNSQATFQRLMDVVVQNIKKKGFEGVEAYVDNILIHSKSIDEHYKLLQAAFDEIRKFNLTLRPDKCEIAFSEIEFLEYHVCENSIKPSQENVIKLLNFPAPTTKKQVQRFLGLANFNRRFVQQYATINKCWSHIAPFSRLYLVKLKVVVQLKSQQ